MHLSERVALVTGGAGGIGQAICRALNGAGAQIAVHYNTQVGQAQNLAAELGNGAAIFQADIAQPATAAALVGRVVAQMGGLDILINNAGITIGGQSVVDMPLED